VREFLSMDANGHHQTPQETYAGLEQQAGGHVRGWVRGGHPYRQFRTGRGIPGLTLLPSEVHIRSQGEVVLLTFDHTVRVDLPSVPPHPDPVVTSQLTDHGPLAWRRTILVPPLPIRPPDDSGADVEAVCDVTIFLFYVPRSEVRDPVRTNSFVFLLVPIGRGGPCETNHSLRETQKAAVDKSCYVCCLVLRCEHAQ
jgi:hypothetical protein